MPEPDIHIVVEGFIDEAVLRRIFKEAGLTVHFPFLKGSRRNVLERLNGYNDAAESSPNSLWVVLVDLNADECAPRLAEEHLPRPCSSRFLFRIAVRGIEAWLMADREGIAKFLKVAKNKVPHDPERVRNPKMEMVRLANRSRSREIKKTLVSPDGNKIGPAYNNYLSEFALKFWNIDRAKRRSESLKRALEAIKNRLREFEGLGRCRDVNSVR